MSDNEEGGAFQVDLVSVKDSYGCKKSLAVPGTSVNVRRVKVSVLSVHETLFSDPVSVSQLPASTQKTVFARQLSSKEMKPGYPYGSMVKG